MNVQIETTAGDVSLKIAQFAGVVSVVTTGTVKCSGTAFGTASSPCTAVSDNALNVVEQVKLNAASCRFLNAMLLRPIFCVGFRQLPCVELPLLRTTCDHFSDWKRRTCD